MNRRTFAMGLVFLLPLSSCGPRRAVQSGTERKTPGAENLTKMLQGMDRGLGVIGRMVQQKTVGKDSLKVVTDLREILMNLRTLSASRPKGELLQQYCDASLGLLTTLERNLEHSYWNEASGVLDQIRRLQSEMDRDFRPGWMDRW